MILTRDLDPGGELKRMAPTLHRLLANEGEHDPEGARARRDWVRRLRGTELFPEVIELWKRNAPSLVPDPARERGSRYGHCADWLQAILELDPQAYQRIVEAWAVAHKRRRNLWQALARRKLPLPGKR
jgi:hypothetical protein